METNPHYFTEDRATGAALLCRSAGGHSLPGLTSGVWAKRGEEAACPGVLS